MIKILADTTSTISVDEAKELGIYYLPQIIVFDDKSYRDDNEITTEEFLDKLRKSVILPKTAAPPPALYTPIYEEIASNGDTALVLAPSSKVSGTYRSAVVAAQDFAKAKIDVIDTQFLRLAGSRSIVRPKLSKLAPRFTIHEDDEAEFGNPDLLPYKAWNLDAGAEYYFGRNAALSIGGFYKSIDNFIVDGFFEDSDAPYNGVYRGTAFSEAIIPVNGDKAEVAGLEASYSQVFDMLPAPFDGLLAQANYTYTWSKAKLFDGRSIALPSNSRNTFNLVLGYEKGPFDIRLAGTYRDKYLDEVGGDAETDRYVDNHFQLDLSVKFKVTDNVRLYGEWVNINNAKYFAYQNYANSQRLLQYEEYGSTFKFGVKANF